MPDNTLLAMEDSMGSQLAREDESRELRENLRLSKIKTAYDNQKKNQNVALKIIWENIENIQKKIVKSDALIDRFQNDLEALGEFYPRGDVQYLDASKNLSQMIRNQQILQKDYYDALSKFLAQTGYKESVTETSKGITLNVVQGITKIGNPYPEKAHKKSQKSEGPKTIDAAPTNPTGTFSASVFD